MKKHNFTTAIFDLDGTMMYTLDDIAESINISLSHFGLPVHPTEKVKTFINDGAFKLIQRAMPENMQDDHEKVQEILEYYNKVYTQNIVVHTKPYDGICELISSLKKLGITLAVASNKPLMHTKEICDKFFPEGTFSYIFGTGDDRPVKPSKAVMDLVLNAINKTPEECLYVGDSIVDVKTARNASLFCCGVLWGFRGKDSFIEAQPDITVNTPMEILDLFN